MTKLNVNAGTPVTTAKTPEGDGGVEVRESGTTAQPNTEPKDPDPVETARALSAISGEARSEPPEDLARISPMNAGFSMRAVPPSWPTRLPKVSAIGLDGLPVDVPKTVMETDNATVVNGTTESAGDFYCEHTLFIALREGNRKGTSVLRNDYGEPMVGFLHVPSDRYTHGTGSNYTQADRHAGTREVIGAALRGYYDQAEPQLSSGPVKILITGYETFSSVRNNPTGEFVCEQENIDAAMARAFGDSLLTPKGEVLAGGDGTPGSRIISYRVRNADGTSREVQVRTESLPVNDAALNPGERDSWPAAMRDFEPHAVISMGVAGGNRHRSEYHADDGGLQIFPDGSVRHAGDGIEPYGDVPIEGDVAVARPGFWRWVLDFFAELFTLSLIKTETFNPADKHRDELFARGKEIGRQIADRYGNPKEIGIGAVLEQVKAQNPRLSQADARAVAEVLLEGITSNEGVEPAEGQRVQPHNWSLSRAILNGKPSAPSSS